LAEPHPALRLESQFSGLSKWTKTSESLQLHKLAALEVTGKLEIASVAWDIMTLRLDDEDREPILRDLSLQSSSHTLLCMMVGLEKKVTVCQRDCACLCAVPEVGKESSLRVMPRCLGCLARKMIQATP
jgi:hypothetical protein